MSSEQLRTDTLHRVQSIVADILALPDLQLREEMTAQDVPGWDSLTHVQIIIAIEQTYGFRFSFAEVAQLQNAGDLVGTILAKSPNL